MGWRERMRDYLSFSRKDRMAVLLLALLIGAVFFLPDILPGTSDSKLETTDTSWITMLRKLEQKNEFGEETGDKDEDENAATNPYDRPAAYHPRKPKGELFYFDPNTLHASEWKRLGLRDKTIGIIQNYLSKGGKFRQPEDLKRIYGLFPDEYERIAPYIRITATRSVNSKEDPRHDQPSKQPEKTYPPKYKAVDINTADTASLIALPGIGSKLATRIINFRDKLGGFYSIAQVGETFGLTDSVFQKIKQYLKLENISIRKININTASVDELKAHPYIRYHLANPIIAYRNEHGPFSKLEDLKKVMAVNEETYSRLIPYLAVN